MGLQGQTTDIKIHADHMVRTRNKMNGILSACTGQIDSKFGFALETGEALQAVAAALKTPGIRVAGCLLYTSRCV